MHAPCKCWQVSIKESYCLLWSFCRYESAKNELKENNNAFGYLFDVNISWIFFKTWTYHKLPPLLLNGLPTSDILNCKLWTHWSACSKYFASNTVLLSPRMTSQASQQCCSQPFFFTLHPQCKWLGMKESDPIFWAHVRANTHLTLPQEMFIAQQ